MSLNMRRALLVLPIVVLAVLLIVGTVTGRVTFYSHPATFSIAAMCLLSGVLGAVRLANCR